MSAMDPRERWALAALGFILVVTGAWWALALWPLPAESPAWLERTRSVCFNTGASGLPDASGWILLVGQPLGMLGALLVGWGEEMRSALGALLRARGGRVLAGAVIVSIAGGTTAAGARVASAREPVPALPDPGDIPSTYPRLDRPLPDMSGLVDQDGRAFQPGHLSGQGTLVTFGYAHCETVCPLLVRSALEARETLAGEVDLRVVVLTLDPWRDTPSRLEAMAEQWGLAPGDLVLGGEVAAVEAALDAWNVARVRDGRTGELVHPALVYLVEPDGTVAYASTGAPSQLDALARRLLD